MRKVTVYEIAIAIVMLIAILGSVIGCLFLVNGREDYQEKTAVIIDENGNEIMDGGAMPKNMVYVPLATGDNVKSITLTATVLPVDATDKTLEWTVDWFDREANAWWQNKNAADYVSVTVLNENSATVTFKQAFGSQIGIYVYPVGQADLKTVCKVDCLKRIDAIVATLKTNIWRFGSSVSGTPTKTETYVLDSTKIEEKLIVPYSVESSETFVDTKKTSVEMSYSYTVGTVEEKYRYEVVIVPDLLFESVKVNCGMAAWTRRAFDYVDEGEYALQFAGDFATLAALYGTNDLQYFLDREKSVRTALCSLETHFRISVTVFGSVEDRVFDFNGVFDKSDLKVPVESVSLDCDQTLFK